MRRVTDPETGEKVVHTVTLDPTRHPQYFLMCDQREWYRACPDR